MPRPDPRAWPLTLKVPLVVAALVIGIAVGISNIVLARLSQIQEENLTRTAEIYLDGLSTALLPHVVRRDIWETFDILDRARRLYAGVHAVHTIVALPDDGILASSSPLDYPVQGRLDDAFTARFAGGRTLVIDEDAGLAWILRALQQDGTPVARVFAEIDISHLLHFRREVQWTLTAVNAALTLLFAFVGYLMVRRMLRPIGLLTDQLDRARGGQMAPISEPRLPAPDTEFGRLFRRFNAMVAAVDEREALAARLAEEEKLVLLGKLASGMAHEVNNPLGGMLNATALIRKHGHNDKVRSDAAALIERGLSGIRNVVRAALISYKGVADPEMLERGHLDDLRFLVQHEVERRRLTLEWDNALPDSVPINGQLARQAVLNLLLNACAASPYGGIVRLQARTLGDGIAIAVEDCGPGLPEEVATIYAATDDAGTPPAGEVGLGVWTVSRLMRHLDGTIAVDSSAAGTRIALHIPFFAEEPLHAVA